MNILYLDIPQIFYYTFLDKISTSHRMDIERDGIDKIEKYIIDNDINIVILKYYYDKPWFKETHELIKKIKLNPSKNNIKFCVFHTLFPSVIDKKRETILRKFATYITDFSLGEGMENSIEIPMLSIYNFPTSFFRNYSPVFSDYCYREKITMFNSEDFHNRQYDVMYKVGKPKTTRVLAHLMLLKHNLKNCYSNLGYSKEPTNLETIDDITNEIFVGLEDVIEKYGLGVYKEKIKIECYLGAKSSKTKTKFKENDFADYVFSADWNTCAEIYTESLTNELRIINEYPNLVSFTEKTFNNFFCYKIPLPIETQSNIDYLKNIGFQFPIDPCIIDSNDSYEDLVLKLDEWFGYLKQFDFRKLWNEWFYNFPFGSPLHHNHQLLVKWLQNSKEEGDESISLYQFIGTYKFLEKFSPNYLQDFINYDNVSYRHLKKLKLI